MTIGEDAASPELKKKYGRFYTPASMVEFILDRAETQTGNILGVRLLDPACGSGQFLRPALRRLVAAAKGSGATPEQIAALAVDRLWGCDVDEPAVAAARARLTAELGRILPGWEPEPQFADRWHLGSINFLQPESDRVFGLNLGFFDLVMGNPPYGAGFTREEKECYRACFRTAGREVNSFALFIEKGLSLLKESGVLAYIVPNNFLMSYHFASLRKHILERAAVLEICDCHHHVFPDAAIDTMVILLRRISKPPQRELNEVKHLIVKTGSLGCEIGTIPQSVYHSDPESRFFLLPPVKIDHKYPCLPLGEIFQVARGIEKGVDAASPTPLPGWVPVLAGRDIDRYRVNFRHRYVEVGPERAIFKDQRVFVADEKLLVRRVGTRLVAAYDCHQYFTLKTVYNLIPRRAGLDLKFFLALLNSRFMDRYARSRLRSPKRTFAEIHQIHLKELPLVVPPWELQKQVSGLVEQLLVLPAVGPESMWVRQEIEDRIEEIVAGLYGAGQSGQLGESGEPGT